jgi:hypothetical protein
MAGGQLALLSCMLPSADRALAAAGGGGSPGRLGQGWENR